MLADNTAGAIFRCEIEGKVVYSDKPCGPNGRAVDVWTNEGYESPQRTPQGAPVVPVAPAPAGQAAMPDPEAQRKERCLWIEQAIKDNETTARLPQTPQKQDRLTAEKRKLMAERDAMSC
jgi:hypothetical protein